jgi:hypothetical protein
MDRCIECKCCGKGFYTSNPKRQYCDVCKSDRGKCPQCGGAKKPQGSYCSHRCAGLASYSRNAKIRDGFDSGRKKFQTKGEPIQETPELDTSNSRVSIGVKVSRELDTSNSEKDQQATIESPPVDSTLESISKEPELSTTQPCVAYSVYQEKGYYFRGVFIADSWGFTEEHAEAYLKKLAEGSQVTTVDSIVTEVDIPNPSVVHSSMSPTKEPTAIDRFISKTKADIAKIKEDNRKEPEEDNDSPHLTFQGSTGKTGYYVDDTFVESDVPLSDREIIERVREIKEYKERNAGKGRYSRRVCYNSGLSY